MNLNCNGQLSVSCDKCGHVNTISCSDLPFAIVERHQRAMGEEKHHNANIEIECAKCGNKISIIYDVWEYPEGVINDVNIEVKGGTIIQECEFEMIE